MTKVLCTLRDIKAGYFYSPVMLNSVDEFKRSINEVVSSKNDQIPVSKYPEDFQLFSLAEYDERNGVISAYEHPIFVANAVDLLDKSVDKSVSLNVLYPSETQTEEAFTVS